MNTLWALNYGILDSDVAYEHGQFIDQWTIKFTNSTNKQSANVRVRYSPLFDEFIEFDVTLSEVPIDDGVGKDVIVNWKMFDDFETNRTFWTDSNGLEMQQRWLDYHPEFKRGEEKNNISGHYFPVNTAIAIRDIKKKMQVTVLNDRTQGGSADLYKNSIELM